MVGEVLDQYGSHLLRGKRYDVLMARGPVFGPTYYRQELANKRNVVCYAEGHLNALDTTPRRNVDELGRDLGVAPGELERVARNRAVNYAMAIVPEGARQVADPWAYCYLKHVVSTFGHRGLGQVQRGGRGSALVRRVFAPAIVLEPGFISNPEFRARISTGEGLDALGKCLADSIRELFPEGGLVGLSIGHAYRDGRTLTAGDPGAVVSKKDDPDPAFDTEAELVEAYITAASEYLTGAP
jgi:N-acetylmuramoyl-L-alanine amidase